MPPVHNVQDQLDRRNLVMETLATCTTQWPATLPDQVIHNQEILAMADAAVVLSPATQAEKEILSQEILVRDRFQCAILPVREKHRSVATALIVVGRRCCLGKPSSDSNRRNRFLRFWCT